MNLKAAIYIFVLVSSFDFEFSSATSTSITPTNFLKDPETLVSSNANFKLGFFSPNNSTNRYLGIWYNKNDSSGMLEVVWVANRDSPLKDSFGVLKISEDMNLKLFDSQNKIHWSSNISYKVHSSVAQLSNTGNLILLPDGSDSSIWQSFDYPTDSLLPGGKLTLPKSINDNKFQSWKSSVDPSRGNFRFVSLLRSLPEFFIVDAVTEKLYWRTGPWNGNLFLGASDFPSQAYFGPTVDDHDGNVDISFKDENHPLLERFVLSYDGSLRQKSWNDRFSKWDIERESIKSECDVYGKCGKFAVCNPKKSPICECFKGHQPEQVDEWMEGNWSSGCVRRTPLQCLIPGGKEDKFFQMKHIKVPDYAQWISASPDDCESLCLANCSCLAYSSYVGIGCMFWNVSMVDLQQYSANGADLFIRLAHSELPGESGKWKIKIAVIVITSAVVCGILLCILWRWMGHKFGNKAKTATPKETQWHNIFGERGGTGEFHDLPLFEFTKLVTATDNFSIINKLGQGGFGPVYKGILEDGQQIAVKRLSRASGQGLQEFMNEVLLISKLQHKNLVRLLGCCIEGEEKLLVYELLPNKSLDAILFDPLHKNLLDWQKRFEIIQGISRGLLYLHRDSRLRIIHRDLKPSNILLDEELNPKISDFGMARIFGSKQDQANTLRVVGTYGYMSPEYAMEGRFSEKSDVFSFGVLLLEIISGRRNNKFQDYDSLNLLAHTWKLWSNNDVIPLIDPTIFKLCFEEQIMMCIKIGLLCVQESPGNRPNVSELISMLDSNDVENLPQPKQPGFTQREVCCTPQNGQPGCSTNCVSLTVVSGR